MGRKDAASKMMGGGIGMNVAVRVRSAIWVGKMQLGGRMGGGW